MSYVLNKKKGIETEILKSFFIYFENEYINALFISSLSEERLRAEEGQRRLYLPYI